MVYLSTGRQPVLLAVGRDAIPEQPHIEVRLFDAASPPRKLPVEKANCLIAFFHHLFESVQGRWSFARPRVVFTGADSLEAALCGYQRALLRYAALQAGARSCRFE
ncbi:MAG: hypothetical protein JXB47_10075 [Anaerolineae bacterium]|nr:hypothetical protein [Anaerolineae bacterium]